MNSPVCFALLLLAFEGALMLLVPHISPHRFLFAVTVPPGFRTSRPGREALRRYHWEVGAAILVAAAAALAIQSRPDWAFAAAAALPVLGATAALVRERGQVRKAAGPAPDVREADLSPDDGGLPRWFALALPPFAAPAAAALYLRARWDQIPARFPTHWGTHGADRWSAKTPEAVYGMPVYGAGTMLLMLLLALATFYGSRRTPQRAVILKIMVALIYLLACLMALIGVQPLFGFSPAWTLVPMALFAIAATVWSYRAATGPGMGSEATPDECWYLGQIYINAQDPAIFVQRRFGFGYTLNLGNLWAWAIVGLILAATVVLGTLLGAHR